MAWRIELFGGPRLVGKSRESFSHFPTQKAAAILAYLALTLPRSHSREVIAELFWPDKDPILARNSLSVCLSALRKLLGDALVSGRLQVSLHPDFVTTDVAEFEARLKAGDVAGATNLARAEFLPCLYDDWVVLERERLAALLEAAQQAQLKTPKFAPLPPSEFLHNLPEPLVSFIGREREREELAELFKTARLVTITGSGGSGKTQLSQYVAREVLDRFSDGVWLIELAPLSDPTLVVRSIASALSISEAAGKPLLQSLIDALKSKEMLLLLDNCEHVLDASAQGAEALLHGCPKLRILATSREALGVLGERSYRIPSLAQNEAIQLFIERGTAFRPELATDSNTPTLNALCTRLDGIPLAIELAAARLRTLSLDELHQRLSQSFALLAGGPRTVLPRHQTLRGLIDWSYALLTANEKTLLCRLSVFAGGWSLEAAERVCSGDGIAACEVLELLTSLVDKSLVVVEREQADTTRYRLLETVRQYGQEQLNEQGAHAVQVAHLEYFRAFCQKSYPKQHQSEAVAELNRVELEHDNIRGALQFGTSASDEHLQREAMKLAGYQRRFWFTRSYLHEARQWYTTILALPVAHKPSEEQGQCLIGAAMFIRVLGDHAEAEALCKKCISEQKALGNDVNVAIALGILAGVVREIQGDSQKALEYQRESLCFAEKANDLNCVAQATINTGIILSYIGQIIESQEMLEKGLALARRQGNKNLIAAALGDLGMLASQRGEYSMSCEFGRENLNLCHELGRNFPLAVAFNYMGVFTQAAGDLTLSRHYRHESLHLSQQLNNPVMCIVVIGDLAELDRLEGHYLRGARLLGATVALQAKYGVNFEDRAERPAQFRATVKDVAAFDQTFAEGAMLTLEEAIALANY